jgi:hypothetical protein
MPNHATMPTELKHADHAVRRRFPRYCFEQEVRIGFLLEHTAAYVHGQGIDLSEGGAAVRTSRNLPVGETVHLRIPLPTGALSLPAYIRYRYGSSYGFEFLALGAAERKYIREACVSLERIG